MGILISLRLEKGGIPLVDSCPRQTFIHDHRIGTGKAVPVVITRQHVHQCVGKWVICHTVRGDIHGRMQFCGGSHIILHVPQFRTIHAEEHDFGLNIDISSDSAQGDVTQAYGYGYGGFARAAIPLAAILGLTVIGAAALQW